MKTPFLAILPVDFKNISTLRTDLQTKEKKDHILDMVEKEITPLVDKYLDKNPDKIDIAWWVGDVIMSETFFAKLGPDISLPFRQRYGLEYAFEEILLPDGSWTINVNWATGKNSVESILNRYKKDHLYVFFCIDY